MDVREVPKGGRVLEVADDVRTLEGVPVRETEALGGALSCFVGDLVGDCVVVSHQRSYAQAEALLLLPCSTAGTS